MREVTSRSPLIIMLLAAAVAAGQAPYRSDVSIDSRPEKYVPPPLAAERQHHYKALKLFLRGQCLQRDHRLPEALQAFEDALKLDPHAAALHKALAAVCFQLDRDRQALDYCRQALELDPSDCALWYRLGQELRDRGELEQAEEAMSKAVALPEAKDSTAVLAQMLFDLGQIRERLKRYDQAADAFEQVAQLLDDSEAVLEETTHLQRKQIAAEIAKTYERLGQAELQAKRYDRAIRAFQRAQEKDPDRGDRLQYNLAEIYLAQGRQDRAIEPLLRFIETRPAGTEAYERLLSTLKQLNRLQEIIPLLEKAAGKDPFNQSLRLLLARQYLENGRSADAERIYLAILDDQPSEEAYRGLAALYQQGSRLDELVQRLDQDFRASRQASARLQAHVLAGDPSLLQGFCQAALRQPQGGQSLSYPTRRVLAGLCREAKQFDHAEHFCRLCLADDPQPGDAYLELCRTLSEAGKLDAEIAVCREALSKTLKAPALVFQLELARALSFTDRAKEAIAAGQEAVRQTQADSPERTQAELNLVAIYYRGGELDKAAASAESLLEQVHETRLDRQIRHLLAGIYSAKHDLQRSEAHLQKLLETDADDAVACNDLGYQWAEHGKNLEKAEELIRKAISLEREERRARVGRPKAGATKPDFSDADNDNAAYIDSLGWVLFKRGQAQEALRELERAAKLPGGEDPVIWEHLGDVYHHLRRDESAKPAWRKAIELFDKSKRVGLEDHRQEVMKKLSAVGGQ
jgi:tetratricopeptide (TPR) repeat protein